jgi:wobble nucleotide-excising tRNase
MFKSPQTATHKYANYFNLKFNEFMESLHTPFSKVETEEESVEIKGFRDCM